MNEHDERALRRSFGVVFYVAVVRSNRTFDLVEPKVILCLGT